MAVILAFAVGIAYSNSLTVPFLFDDRPAILENASIRDVSNVGEVLWPNSEGGVTTSGRPILNLSFAINYALGGIHPFGYHVGNLAIHYLSTLLLFGVVRRVFSLRPPCRIPQLSATTIAAALSALWMLHPLHTSAVTYLAQRAESLCGLFLLATIYTFIRATESARPRLWFAASVAVCALGMGTKEVMVSAPLLVLLVDRTFIAGSFAKALSTRRSYYFAMAGTWLILAALVFATSGRGTTAGFQTVVSPWDYLLTQCAAVVHYLRLAVWPHPLVFDYGTAIAESFSSVWWQALLLASLAGGTVWALIARPAVGFWAMWFFVILAPSSSVVPIASQTMAEHRMYLPSVAVLVLVVSVAARLFQRPVLFGVFAAGIAVVSGLLSAERNRDYRSERAIWEDTAAEMPGNPRAHINLAMAFSADGNYAEALDQLDLALGADPRSADAHYNRGVLHSKFGRGLEAEAAYRSAVEFFPKHAEALNNLGNVSLDRGDLTTAIDYYARAVAARPHYGDALCNLSGALLDIGRTDEALLHAEAATTTAPDSAEAAFRLGNALLGTGRASDAIKAFERAVDLDPSFVDAHNNLANLLVEREQLAQALVHYRKVIALRPEVIPARRNAAIILAHLGHTEEAVAEFETLAGMAPEDPFFAEQLSRLQRREP